MPVRDHRWHGGESGLFEFKYRVLLKVPTHAGAKKIRAHKISEHFPHQHTYILHAIFVRFLFSSHES